MDGSTMRKRDGRLWTIALAVIAVAVLLVALRELLA